MSVLTFLGAARTVTGSKTLVDSDGTRLLVDCGLFQGERTWRRRNWDPPPVDPSTLDAMVVTHAHLDHCGYLPVMARKGFSGPVLCSHETAQLMGIVLRDAAHLQEEEARWARTSGLSKHADPRPLYDTADAERALALLRPLPTGELTKVGDIGVTLHRAGHILGSRFAVLDVGGVTVAFSGDLGRPGPPAAARARGAAAGRPRGRGVDVRRPPAPARPHRRARLGAPPGAGPRRRGAGPGVRGRPHPLAAARDPGAGRRGPGPGRAGLRGQPDGPVRAGGLPLRPGSRRRVPARGAGRARPVRPRPAGPGARAPGVREAQRPAPPLHRGVRLRDGRGWARARTTSSTSCPAAATR